MPMAPKPYLRTTHSISSLSRSLQIYYLYLLIVVKSYIYLSLINTQLYPTSKDDFPIQTTVMSTTKSPWFSPRNSWLRRTSDVHWAVVLSRCPSGIDHPQRWFHHLGWFDVNMLRTKHINKQGDIYIYIYIYIYPCDAKINIDINMI